MAGTFWKDTVDFLITGMGTDLFAKSANLITHIAPLFSMGFGIYFMIIILNAYNRGFDGNAIDLAKKTAAWLLIIACAFNAGQYNHLANMLYEMPEWLASLFGNNSYNTSALDAAWNSIMQGVEDILAKAAELDFVQLADKVMLYVNALFIVILAIIFFAIVTAFYVVAKLSLAMVILIGPLFLGFLLFPSTRQYGMNWLGQVLNYAITITFYVILGALQMDFFHNHLEKAITGDLIIGGVLGTYGLLPMFLISTAIFIIVAWSIPSIASALTGGASISGFSNFGRMANSLMRGRESPIKGFGLKQMPFKGITNKIGKK